MSVLTLALLLAADPAPAYADHADLMLYRDAAGVTRPVKTADDWKKRREHILMHMQSVMGPLPGNERKVPLEPKITETVRTAKYTRYLVTIAVEKGDRLPMYLFVPKVERPAKLPAVLCLHPTSKPLGKGVAAGYGDRYDRAYAVHLVERGYVTLAPDYVNMGDYKVDAYAAGYDSATMKGIWNHMRAVDYLQSLPEVDGDRIGVIGHSLGGHNSMFVAAFDERLKCVVSNCGFCSFPTYMKGNLAGWDHDGYMPRIKTVYHLDPTKMPFDFPEVVAAIAPRAFLASAPTRDHNFDMRGAKDCVTAARPVYQLLGVGERLKENYPESEHHFPDDARAVAYDFLDLHLQRGK